MDRDIKQYFAHVITVSSAAFTDVEYTIDETPKRSILRLQAMYGSFRLFVTELFSENRRKYRYYLLKDNWVEVGFDNSPDPRALRLKYGQITTSQVGELVPHLHLANKTELFLTDEISYDEFLDWLSANILA
ncbi:MAG: hypothetical protein KC423_24140 [Anaerolineales bacterium]|nr:hypothetical protein [Anaerolineales bacterium]